MSFQFSKGELLYQRQQFYENMRNSGVPCRIYSIENVHEDAYDFYNDINNARTYTKVLETKSTYEVIFREDRERGSSADPIDLTDLINSIVPIEDVESIRIGVTVSSHEKWTQSNGVDHSPSCNLLIGDEIHSDDKGNTLGAFGASNSILYTKDIPEGVSTIKLEPFAFNPRTWIIDFEVSVEILSTRSSFDDYIDTYMTFEELPTIKTLKSLGWYVDSEAMPAVGYIPVLYQDKRCKKASFKPNVDDKIIFKANPYDQNSSERAFLLKDFKGNGFPSVIYYTVKLVPCYNDKRSEV